MAEGAGGQPSPSGPGAAGAAWPPDGGRGRAGRWSTFSIRGRAAALVSRPFPEADTPASAWLVRPVDDALVLGSTQIAPVAGPGLAVVRRRSGGGAVLVGPGRMVWVEVFVPPGDPRWSSPVDEATWWLGEVWADALGQVGHGPATVHRGPVRGGEVGRTVCFAGLGPGEVSLGEDKVVGISQRRTRAGAMFFCAALLRWDGAEMARAVGMDPERAADLSKGVSGLAMSESSLAQAFLGALARR